MRPSGRTLTRPLRLAAAFIAFGLVVSAAAVGAIPAQAAAPGTPQYCLETLTCTIGDFNAMSLPDRLKFVEALENGYAQAFQAGFNEWGAIEGVIEFFMARNRAATNSWASLTDAGIVQGLERGLAMALGTDSMGDMGNPGADLWQQYLQHLAAGKLTDRATHDAEWSTAEQTSTDYGKCVAEGQPTCPTQPAYHTSPLDQLEQTWYAGTQAGRWLLRNYGSLVNALNALTQDPNNPYTTAIYALTDVTKPQQWFLYSSAIWFNAGLVNLPTDAENLINDFLGTGDPNNVGADLTAVENDINALIHPCGQCTGGGQTPPPAYSVYDVLNGGAFRSLWNQTGGVNGLLGDPTANWSGVAGGQSQTFAGAHAYWSSFTGTHEVHGAINSDYQSLGGPSSALGFPTSNEEDAPGGGRVNLFPGTSCGASGLTGSGSTIYWTSSTGAHEMQGCIYQAYVQKYGGPGGALGYPTTDETSMAGGRYNHLSGTSCGSSGGSGIYWNGAAHEVYGCIFQKYKSIGEATSGLGFPVSDEYAYNGGRRQDFQGGNIIYTSSTGAVVNFNGTSCTDYGGSTMTGPNACTGFHTAPPPGQPASGNVWFSGGGTGFRGQEIWTYGNGTTATSTADYNLTGLDTSHVMQLQAYIPDNHSDASHAHYHYCSPGGGCADGYINQNNYTNAWVTFGSVCTTDGTATIVLADDGGDNYPAEIGADAIRAIPTNLGC